MLAALEEAHTDRWDRRDEMLRTLILRVDALVRWQAVRHGENHEDPGPITVLGPGEQPPPKAWVQALRSMGGG